MSPPNLSSHPLSNISSPFRTLQFTLMCNAIDFHLKIRIFELLLLLFLFSLFLLLLLFVIALAICLLDILKQNRKFQINGKICCIFRIPSVRAQLLFVAYKREVGMSERVSLELERERVIELYQSFESTS